MYHFLRTTTEKIFHNSFDRTKKIDPNKEQIINFCPKCSELLDDKRVITLLKHENEKHPKTDKEMLTEFYGRGAMPMLLVVITASILTTALIGYGYVSDMMWKNSLSEKEIEFNKFCTDLVENMPEMKFFWETWTWDNEPYHIARGDYILKNLENLKKCQYTVQLYSLVSDEKRIERFRETGTNP